MIHVGVLAVLLNTTVLGADSKGFLLPFVEDQLLREVFDHFKTLQTKLLEVEVFDALMALELVSWVLFIADLAHYFYSWTLRSDMDVQFLSGQVLKLGHLADIATELGTVKLAMLMQLCDSPPDNLFVAVYVKASMRELAEVNQVLEHFVNVLKIWTLDLTVRTVHLWLVALFKWHAIQLLLKLKLTVLAEKLVAPLALLWLEGELEADNALDFFNHLLLELVLEFIHLDVKRRNRFLAHDVSCLLITENQVYPLGDRDTVFVSIHLLEDLKLSLLVGGGSLHF